MTVINTSDYIYIYTYIYIYVYIIINICIYIYISRHPVETVCATPPNVYIYIYKYNYGCMYVCKVATWLSTLKDPVKG